VCELLAVSTSQPARLTFSLRTLASHGSATGLAHDGWGVAFYQGSDVALFREPAAAAESELVRFLECHGPSTGLAVSHIRHATWGAVQFSNTQPFIRELGGDTHVFAHNGYLTGIDKSAVLTLGIDRPIGQTDSELAFCALLARMRTLWGDAGLPPVEARMTLLATFAADLRALGAANFLYADGDALFAHGHRRLTRLDGPIEPPGLWTLRRHRAPSDPPPVHEAGVAVVHGDTAAVFIASVPLTDEAWRPLHEGELMAVRDGEVIATRLAVPTA
jgi:predicted glutamine amidotransferase